jgi:ABC-type transporter MlaC component
VVDRLVTLEQQIRKEGPVTEEALKKQDKQIREAVSAVLDLEAIGRYALSSHWEALAAQEGGEALLKDYMRVFKNLVEENYLERARQYLSGDHEIRFSREFKEEERGEDFIVVEGSIKQPDIDLILQFYVQKEGEAYQVHDIRLDETSLRGTYRGSFNRTVGKRLRAAQDREQGRREGVSELVNLMNSRLAERQGENGNSRL